MLCFGKSTKAVSKLTLGGNVEIFDQEGLAFLSRYGHVLFGVTWVGLLYYFNVVQVPSFAQFEAASRTEAINKLVPRALWWFRWAAMLTFLSGLLILAFQEQYSIDYLFRTAPGISILTGMLLGITMFLNVWLVIWPKQKVVIENARRTAAGEEALPDAAAAGRKALLASRTNTFFSIPMLFFMVFTSHFSFAFIEAGAADGRLVYWIVVLALWGAFEANGLGMLGTETGGLRVYLDDHKNTIIAGLVYLVVLYLLWELLLT
jgi:uncharacterized membrane protein